MNPVMQKTKLKISSSAYRVLLLLKKLNEKDYSINELNNIFWEDPYVKRFFSTDVILKYINTLKMAGYDLSKCVSGVNSCYQLNNSQAKIVFSNNEIKILSLLKKFAESLHQKKHVKNYSSFLKKIKRHMIAEDLEKFKHFSQICEQENSSCFGKFDKYSQLISIIEQYIEDKQRVELKYQLPSENNAKIVPIDLQCIKYNQDEAFIVCYNLISNQTLSLNMCHILNIRQLPVISRINPVLCPVIFKVKDKLAKVYRPYEKEKLSDPDQNGDITVTSLPDDIDALLKRLLRYGENCEILYPKLARDKMISLIKHTLANYN